MINISRQTKTIVKNDNAIINIQRCDGVWNCADEADEIQCFNSIYNGTFGHPCIRLNTNKLICLPVSRIRDGIDDCLVAIDEQKTCRESNIELPMFRCLTNNTKLQLSNE